MDKILNDYLSTKCSILSLSEKYNISYYKIYKYLKLNTKILSNRDRYCKVDSSMFNLIETEQDAYWLGFLFADGNVYTKKGKNTITLSLIDKEHVEKFKNYINVENKIYEKEKNTTYGLTKSFTFQFSSIDICNNLKKYGIIDQKSKNDKLSLLDIDDKLSRHFWRGIIDGDGWVINKKFKNRNKIRIQPVIGLCGSLKTCNYFLDFLIKNEIKFKSKIRIHKSIFCIQFSDSVAINILKLLYDNSNIYLDRKKETSNRILIIK